LQLFTDLLTLATKPAAFDRFEASTPAFFAAARWSIFACSAGTAHARRNASAIQTKLPYPAADLAAAAKLPSPATDLVAAKIRLAADLAAAANLTCSATHRPT